MPWTIDTTHRLVIDQWRPVFANELLKAHWGTAAKRKRIDRQMVQVHALRDGIPRATGRRRVRLTIAGPWRRPPDPDAPLKSTLDALTAAGLLIDDSARWCQFDPPEFVRAPEFSTTIELTDLDG